LGADTPVGTSVSLTASPGPSIGNTKICAASSSLPLPTNARLAPSAEKTASLAFLPSAVRGRCFVPGFVASNQSRVSGW